MKPRKDSRGVSQDLLVRLGKPVAQQLLHILQATADFGTVAQGVAHHLHGNAAGHLARLMAAHAVRHHKPHRLSRLIEHHAPRVLILRALSSHIASCRVFHTVSSPDGETVSRRSCPQAASISPPSSRRTVAAMPCASRIC